MGRLFFLCLLAGTSVAGFFRPWIGVVAAYLMVVMVPQAVWWYSFRGLRPVYWVLLPTLAGFLFATLKGDLDYRALWNKRNMFMFLLWVAFTISYFLGPYVHVAGPYRFTDAAHIFETLNKIFLLYFVGCVCITDEKRLKALFVTVTFSAAFLIYWANDQYLSGRVFGRLAGPVDQWGAGAYVDENVFAMVFVVAQPFLWYAGYAVKSKPLRWAIWLIIPFGWHAIFLTASRGGLVGIGIATLLMVLRSKNKLYGLLLIPAFFFAYEWQAGDLMKSRADTISEYKTETSASTRLEAWAAARGMIASHPFTGVGLASFGPAFPHHSDKKPREAHNTFFQITAESGVLAGSMYAALVIACVMGLWRTANRFRRLEQRDPEATHDLTYLITEATLIAFCGFVVCSLFLSLQIAEIFYCLCLLANAALYASAKVLALREQSPAATTMAPARTALPGTPAHHAQR